MSSRIPDLNVDKKISEQSERILTFVEENSHKYEEGFLSSLMGYIKEDRTLQSFFVRLVYECEVVQIVIKKRTDFDLKELASILDEMKGSSELNEIAAYDSSFHRRLFAIAEEDDFFEWYQLQSKSLRAFLKGFWSYIGYQTDYYYDLMEIHTNIYKAIEQQDEALALDAMQKHFSILLLELLGATFQHGSE